MSYASTTAPDMKPEPLIVSVTEGPPMVVDVGVSEEMMGGEPTVNVRAFDGVVLVGSLSAYKLYRAEYEVWKDETLDPPSLVVKVGRTELRGIGIHPNWHPHIKTPEDRLKVFRAEYPEFFE